MSTATLFAWMTTQAISAATLFARTIRLRASIPGLSTQNVAIGVSASRSPLTTPDLTAEVPLAEMFGYTNAIRSLSRGRASYAMTPSAYEVAPEGFGLKAPPEPRK